MLKQFETGYFSPVQHIEAAALTKHITEAQKALMDKHTRIIEVPDEEPRQFIPYFVSGSQYFSIAEAVILEEAVWFCWQLSKALERIVTDTSLGTAKAVNELAKCRLSALHKLQDAIAEKAKTISPDYPGIETINPYEQLYAIHSSYEGCSAANDDLVKELERVKDELRKCRQRLWVYVGTQDSQHLAKFNEETCKMVDWQGWPFKNTPKQKSSHDADTV